MLTHEEAKAIAARMGLSTWVVEAVAVGPRSHTVELMCVGFASVDVAIAEAETWEEALQQTMKIVFGA